MEIKDSVTYQISSDRIREICDEKGKTLADLWRAAPIEERSFKRNLNEDHKMKGETLLAISKELNCTPYYFLEPPCMPFMEPLQYWHYEYQTVSIDQSFYDFFLARNLPPDAIAKISKEDRRAFEEYAQQMIDKYKKS